MHSHEHASLNRILFNDRLEHAYLDELCLFTCLIRSFFCASTFDVIWWHNDGNMLGFMLCQARWMLEDVMYDRCMLGFMMWLFAWLDIC